MSNGLRADVIRAFENARAQIKAPGVDALGLPKAVTGWIDGPSRFLAPDPEVAEGRRAVAVALDALAEQAGQEAENPRRAASARGNLLDLLGVLERLILQRGRANELADRVGLGTLGRPI